MAYRVVAGRLLFLSTLIALHACGASRVPPVPPDSPFYGSSLPPHDAAMRHYLTLRDSSALDQLLASGPRDELIKRLNAGLFLHRLGRYTESNVALQRAEALAEERYTKSIGQNVAAFLVSDNVLDFYPSALEWSMIHYYGMMNYLALDDVENALVEARKANALLRRYANDNPGRSFTNPAALQYIAGMLQWSAGEDNDAMVSLRQSLTGYDDYEQRYGVAPPRPVAEDVARVASVLGFDDVAEETRKTYLSDGESSVAEPAEVSADMGELMVVIENGFVAHKAEEKLYVPVLASEKDSVLSGNAGSAVLAAVRVLIRTVAVMNYLSQEGVDYPRHEDGVVIATAGSAVGLELISLAWPSYQLAARRASDIRVSVNDERSIAPTIIQDLSAIAVRDFEESKPTIMLRMVSRGLLKEAAVTAVEAAGEDRGGALGGFLGRVTARAVATATERADTRSWSTLPAELLLARFQLPTGSHVLRISYDGLNHRRELIELEIEIEAGRVTTQTVSLLGDDEGNGERIRIARTGVHYEAPKAPETQRRTPPRRRRYDTASAPPQTVPHRTAITPDGTTPIRHPARR